MLLASASSAFADGVVQSISTNSLAYGQFGSASGGLGPWPFSNFGVQASTNLATDVSAGVQGATQFTFPTIQAGDIFHASTSQLDYGYSADWTNATIGSHSGLSASASFNYDIGPFSGSKSIYDQALNTTSNGNLGTGATLTGGAANSVAVGDKYGASYGLSAYVASASIGLNVGLDLRNDISYTPTVSYGYYSWINTGGGLSGADDLTWNGVSSGNLGYLFPSNLSGVAGSSNFYLNFMPAVRMNLSIDGSSTVTVPLDGTLKVEAFGSTLVDASLPLGNLYDNKQTYSTWNDNVEWNNGLFYSLKLHQDNLDCQRHPSDSCATYTVESQPTFVSQTLLPQDTTHDYRGTSTGGFDPGLGHAPKVPPICDPQTGECWQSDDPNAPIGPGSETFTVSSVPEPGSWALMVVGLGLLGTAVRRSRRVVLRLI
ncbi:MAG: PEPxxWA-CTERM sorting domain-containing protein [Caldimonas sp.]